jgi:eukaryotic-like serine/threonine-protein kinase
MVPTMMTQTPVTSTATNAVLPSVLADRYEILGLLGIGGMGRVYRARDRKLDEIVALKVLRRELVDTPGMLERFRQEVRLARRVTSPHVVRTFDLGEHEADHFLTMEFIDGQSLARLLDAGPLPLAEVLRIARATCDGIAAAHAAGVLHRDLKPDNILVAKSDRIAITDFGIAHAQADPGTTGDGFIGTPAYMAPEQIEAKATIGPAADLYALGAILFEMLTERRPFPGSDPFAVALARLRQPPPDPRTLRPVPDALAELVVCCLARDPAGRPAGASALALMLDELADLPARTAPPRPMPYVPAVNTSRAVAFLPLRATGDLAELADGLSEEIVDALTMTRELRIRPITTVRAASRADLDARDIGKALDVDVIVEGSMRRRAELVRISARAIGVVDGFQLWANHFDTEPNGLLAVGDEVARAIARALTVEITLPERIAPSSEAVALYLEGKAKLRAMWFSNVAPLVPDLERAYQLAPDDPNILATLSMALSRSAFFASTSELPRARVLAERAVALAPDSGEPWFALGIACLYTDAIPDAARALRRALSRATGLAMAQAMLGGILLEAGALDDAIAHLEAAARLDPSGTHFTDLPRAYIYSANRYEDAYKLMGTAKDHGRFAGFQYARLRMWQGELTQIDSDLSSMPTLFGAFLGTLRDIYRTGTLEPAARAHIAASIRAMTRRLRVANTQFVAELFAFLGDHDAALEYIELGVDAGLQDRVWLERCPLLAPLRDRPRFRELSDIVVARATAVLAAVRDEA